MQAGEVSGAADGKIMAAIDPENGQMIFPIEDVNTDGMTLVPLAHEGELWSFTVQRFRPKSPPYAGPEAFEPYIVGYVKLPGQLMIEARIVGVEPEQVKIGMQLELCWVPLDPAQEDSVRMHAFRPLKEASL